MPAYSEPARQQLHYSARDGWLNDPNGLCFLNGVYHMFHQYNPGPRWSNMHWNHAVSTDLVHWRELGIALAPEGNGMIFSGGAVVDRNNDSGLGRGGETPLLFFYTLAGKPFRQCLAFSIDGGTTVQKYGEDKPLIPNIGAFSNRDPSVAWDDTEKCWRLALFLDDPQHHFALFRSQNLLDWSECCRFRIPGDAECPELLFMTDAVTGEQRWVIFAANGNYLLGDIRHDHFSPVGSGRIFSGQSAMPYCGNTPGLYAAQTFKNLPDGRHVILAWCRDFPRGGEFSQSMSFPADLTLENGTLRVRPVPELLMLRTTEPTDFYEAEFTASPDAVTLLNFDGNCVIFDGPARETRVGADRIAWHSDTPGWRIYLDRNTLEFFGDDGRVWLSASITRYGTGVGAWGNSKLPENFKLHYLQSIWR